VASSEMIQQSKSFCLQRILMPAVCQQGTSLLARFAVSAAVFSAHCPECTEYSERLLPPFPSPDDDDHDMLFCIASLTCVRLLYSTDSRSDTDIELILRRY
jgi:hypothetical protein